MSLAVVTSGTLSITATTETNLESARSTSLLPYVFKIDLGGITSGHMVFCRLYTIALASGTERLEAFGSFLAGTDLDPMIELGPVPMDTGTGITIRATVQDKGYTSGTLSVPWKLFTL